MIGIKLADGTLFPVLRDELAGRPTRVVLTTVRDHQSNVQVDIYRAAEGSAIEHAEYIASLVLENLESVPRGEADIDLTIRIDEKGNLISTATETKTGQYQSLSVSLDVIRADADSPPDFGFPDSEAFAKPEIGDFEPDVGRENEVRKDGPDREPKRHPLLLTIFVLLGFGVVGGLLYVVFLLLKSPPVPPVPGV